MQANRRVKADFVLPLPVHFHHRHLSLSKQRKDKEIKKQRE
jgi:CRISPR/Cas system endoribonuclease Cas6 (RAMP superfamily)